ncbi:MAG: TolC family protein [Vicinamibacterales bacterium]
MRAELAATRALLSLTARLGVEATLESLVLPDPPPLPPPADGQLARRPDVSAAASAVQVARQALRVEDARAIPDPALNAGYKRTVGYNTAQVTVTVPIPLFNRNRPARILARGQVSAAELEQAAVERRRARRHGRNPHRRRMLARGGPATPARRSCSLPRARDAARASFSTGVLTSLRLVDAERLYRGGPGRHRPAHRRGERGHRGPACRGRGPSAMTFVRLPALALARSWPSPRPRAAAAARRKPTWPRPSRRRPATTTVTVSKDAAGVAGIEVAPARLVERTDPLQASGVVAFDERRTAHRVARRGRGARAARPGR